jgi:hypothetical protein
MYFAKLAMQWHVAFGNDLLSPVFLEKLEGSGFEFAFLVLCRIDHLNIFTDVDTLATHNAALHIKIEHETSCIFGNYLSFDINQVCDLVAKCHVLEFASSISIAYGTIKGMRRKVLRNSFLASLK